MRAIRIIILAQLALCTCAVFASPVQSSSWISDLAKAAQKLDRAKYAWAPRDLGSTKNQSISSGSGPSSQGAGTSGALKVDIRDSSIYVFDGKSFWRLEGEEARQYLEAMNARHKKVGKAEELTRAGNLREARAALVPLVLEAPYDEVGLKALAEVCLREEKYAEVLALLSPILTPQASEETILRAAFAGAMTDRNYPGLKSYCDQVTARMAAGMEGGVKAIPAGTDGKAARISVCLAMGSMHAMHGDDQSARPYFERTLNLDPKNSWAGFSLGGIYARRGALADAKRAYGIAVKNASGMLRRIAQQELSSVEYRIGAGG